MAYVKHVQADHDKMAELIKAIDAATDAAIAFSEEKSIPVQTQGGLYIPESAENEALDEEPETGEEGVDYDYVGTEETGWVSSQYNC